MNLNRSKLSEFCQLLTRLTTLKPGINEDLTEEQYDDFQLQVVKDVPFISKLQGEHTGAGTATNRSILVQSINQSNGNEHYRFSGRAEFQTESPTITTTMSELDVTGSPLRCTFDDDFTGFPDDTIVSHCEIVRRSKSLSQFRPLDINAARLIVSMYNLCCDPQWRSSGAETAFPFLPLWVVCDGNDPDKTILIGGHFRESRMSRSIVKCIGKFLFTVVMEVDYFNRY